MVVSALYGYWLGVWGLFLRGNSNLSPCITELGKRGVEQSVLFDERLIAVWRARLLGLESHVCIGNLRDGGHEKAESQDEDEDGNGEVDPLHVLQSGFVVKGEEDVGAQDGGNHGADCIEGLGNVDSDFRVLRRPANYGQEQRHVSNCTTLKKESQGD